MPATYRLGGKEITALKPQKARELGIAAVFQEFMPGAVDLNARRQYLPRPRGEVLGGFLRVAATCASGRQDSLWTNSTSTCRSDEKVAVSLLARAD